MCLWPKAREPLRLFFIEHADIFSLPLPPPPRSLHVSAPEWMFAEPLPVYVSYY